MADPIPNSRNKFIADVSSYDRAVAVVNAELQAGRLLNALDVCEQIVDAHPGKAIAFLKAVYDLLQTQPNFMSRYLYQSRVFDFGIQPGWKVIDIGSGNDPFPLATHLADLTVSDNQVGRAGAAFKELQGRPVYECNIERLPFADKEFDLVFCSHVLEHVGDPEKACRELMRIGRYGYIETPTRGKDLLFDYAKVSHHKWAVERFGDRLVFTEYSSRDIEGLSCDILNHFLANPATDREKAFSALMFLKADRINTMLLWQDQFQFEVRRLGRQNESVGVSVPESSRCVIPTCSASCSSCSGASLDRAGSSLPVSSLEPPQTKPAISVVIPTYNRAPYLPRAIQSILSQTQPVDEILIVDDESTDNTEQVVRQLHSQHGRIHYLRLPLKGGAQKARNAGIQAAAGDWIAFLDSDDVWLPDRIRLCLEKAREMNVSAVYTEAYMRKNDQLTLMKRCSAQGYIFPDMLKSPGPMFQGLLVRKECLLRVGLLDESLPAWQEWDAFLRLSQYYTFAFVPEPCFVWDAHENETISKDKSRDAAAYERIVETWKEQILRHAGPEALEQHVQAIRRKKAACGQTPSNSPDPNPVIQAQLRQYQASAPEDRQSYLERNRDIADLRRRLVQIGIPVRDYAVDVRDFEQWRRRFPELDRMYAPLGDVHIEKLLEHYLTCTLLNIRSGDILIDVAACGSPWAQVLRREGIESYRLDLSYPKGIHGVDIGADAAEMPLPDASVTALTLHCAYECFQNDSDKRFIIEAERVLNDRGRLAIVPLYLDPFDCIITSPHCDQSQIAIDPGFKKIWREDIYKSPFSRHYSPEGFVRRIGSLIRRLRGEVRFVANMEQLRQAYPGQRIYCYFTFVGQKIGAQTGRISIDTIPNNSGIHPSSPTNQVNRV
jgi:ubiquinone/menaquinone biosynthesis C-methylase UbiE